jgi:hypothetical protein
MIVMRLNIPSKKRLALLLLVVVPIAAWMIIKPVRVIAPQLVGVSCPIQTICVDDLSKLQVATGMYTDAVTFVSSYVGPLDEPPKVIFCSTEACASSFGLGARSAVTFGSFGTVIRPRAWKPYYVRHELIHHLQVQHLGVFGMLFKPSWFVEGMAYSLSQDPRTPLDEPFEGYRNRFLSWYSSIERVTVWQEAQKL